MVVLTVYRLHCHVCSQWLHNMSCRLFRCVILVTLDSNTTDPVVVTYDLISADSCDNCSVWPPRPLPPDIATVVVITNFWTHAVLVKLVPCFLMLLFGCLLVSTARDSHRRASRLQRQRSTDYQLSKQRRRLAERNRTTVFENLKRYWLAGCSRPSSY